MARFRARIIHGATRSVATMTFGGIDSTSPRFQVGANYAIDMNNYVWRDKAVQKRLGTEQKIYANVLSRYIPVDINKGVITSQSIDLTSPTFKIQGPDEPIYDMWFLKDILIVHKGSLLYYWDRIDDNLKLICYSSSKQNEEDNAYYYYTVELPKKTLQGFIGNNKLWILTGVKYMVLEMAKSNNNISFEFLPVENYKEVYIPTTTIGIAPNGSKVENRVTVDGVNLLTKWRKNTAIGKVEKITNEDTNRYVLDGSIFSNDEEDYKKIKINITVGGTN